MIKKNTIVAFAAGMATVMCATVAAQQFGGLMFPDVLPNDYFFDSVTRFAKKGIVNGYNNGSFSPHDYVTRGQVTVIVDRYDQQVVRKMRDQIELMRNQLGLGSCGDGEVQVGEDCDDENLLSGDGCSAECLQEIHCAGGYKIGDRYPAPDGCNTCTCTESGIACTERSCTLKKCFTSGECAQSEICSVEEGDCRYPCPVGAVCIQACAGVCLPRENSGVCGNNICDEGESAFPDRTGNLLYCPQDCSLGGAVCGDAICSAGEADEYRLEDEGLQLIRRGTCSEDCEGGLTACEQQKKSVDIQFTSNMSCSHDEDCTVFVRGCSPYQTCGKPIRKDSILTVTASVLDYVDECGGEEPSLCAGCIPNSAVCKNNVCAIVEGAL
ncbi:MAG: S-layer homology domain-containing protein [Candidatus Peribacteraceae bacterium]|nr:S-layer homology domain-containing protein [Candidatus Peribacteraceae bacterium]